MFASEVTGSTVAEMPAMSAVGEYLPWDSEFFGYRIGRVKESVLVAGTSAYEINVWVQQEYLECVYACVDADNTKAVFDIEDAGFHFVNIKVTLEADVRRITSSPLTTSEATLKDFSEDMTVQLVPLVRGNHMISRFFSDRHFDPQRAASLYEVWLMQCCRDSSVKTFIACMGPTVVGYICCKKTEGRKGSIVLAGVAPNYRRHGIGTQLVAAAQDWFINSGVWSAEVVTQGSNIDALRLYTSMGFFQRQTELWYHKWF